jgi:cyclophilin family peptidyl-prolyl cis-trans isomerase
MRRALPLLALLLSLTRAAQPQTLPDEPGLYAVIDTSLGTMVALLYDDKAPITVNNFIALATGAVETLDKSQKKMQKKPYFDGLTFHRVIPGFMIQGGDVKGTGDGNCGIKNIPDEIDPSLTFEYPGRLAMANTGQPNSGACQFFITVGRAEHLNGKHTIFGQLMTGFEVANAIATVKTTPGNNRPINPVIIKSIRVLRKKVSQ